MTDGSRRPQANSPPASIVCSALPSKSSAPTTPTPPSLPCLVATKLKVSTDTINFAHPIALKAALEELEVYNSKAPKGHKLNHQRLCLDLKYALRTQVSFDVKIYSDSEFQQRVESQSSSMAKHKATPGVPPMRRHATSPKHQCQLRQA